MSKFYLTTAIPYVNAKPHLGHALEYVQADVVNRYHRLIGDESFFVSGADENALKNVQAAEKEGLAPARFLDKYSKIFADFYKLLGANLDEFRRGTDQKKHWPGVQKLWRAVVENDKDRPENEKIIYKKKYSGLYCVGCESFKTEKDLVDGKCPDHNRVPERVEEENYFFRLSKFQDFLVDLIETDKLKIYPQKRKNEILQFIVSGLEDFSISRSNERARGIGVPVPEDDSQKIYVWFDALVIYTTGVGFGYDDALWKKWWPADLHIIGKDIIRFHAIYWPAMLKAAGLPLPKKILVHGFITSDGKKMGKSLGNAIDPYQIIEKYEVEALRYYLLSQIPTQDDGDFTIEKFERVYQADLANGLGNLTSRVQGLGDNLKFSISPNLGGREISRDVAEKIEIYEFDKALRLIWERIKKCDVLINEKEVWKLKGENKKKILNSLVEEIRQIGVDLQPFLPKIAKEILRRFEGEKIIKGESLFPRLDK